MADPKRVIWFDPGGRVVHAESVRDVHYVHMVCGARYDVCQVRDYKPDDDPQQHYRPDCQRCFVPSVV